MVSHGGGVLTHYLINFSLYTLGAIALIYAAYGYVRRRLGLGSRGAGVDAESPAESKPAENASPSSSGGGDLMLESVLALEEKKTLYVVRTGQERFLIGAGDEDVQCLARLKDAASKSASATDKTPWYTEVPPPAASVEGDAKARFSERMTQSLSWLITSRAPKG